MQQVSIYNKMTYSEREVACLLRDLGVYWDYEKPIFIRDSDRRPRVWTPDFYLIQFGVYVEVCGSKEFDYEYRKKIFQENGYKVIFLHLYKSRDKWLTHLKNHLESIIEYRYQKMMQIMKKVN